MLWHVSVVLSFLWMDGSPIFHSMGIPHFASPFTIDGHLDCFPFLVVMNNPVMNIHVQVFAWTHVFISRKYHGVKAPGFMVDLCVVF